MCTIRTLEGELPCPWRVVKKVEEENGVAAWRDRLGRLASDVEKCAKAERWRVTTVRRRIEEDLARPYSTKALHIETPKGRVDLEPIALRVLGGDGRVDLRAWPSSNRVQLLAKNGDWVVYTDSNIPWPNPWSRETFVELARSLAATN